MTRLRALWLALLGYVQSRLQVVPTPPIVAPAPIKPPTPMPVNPPLPSAAQRLADAATFALGTDASPKNLAPQELSCAEGVSNIVHKVFSDFPAEVLSTVALLAQLKASKHFKPVLDPARGCVVVSPTTGDNHGHTGIYVEDDSIASNDSRDGKFHINYTRASWRAYFIAKKGLKGYLFMPVDIDA